MPGAKILFNPSINFSFLTAPGAKISLSLECIGTDSTIPGANTSFNLSKVNFSAVQTFSKAHIFWGDCYEINSIGISLVLNLTHTRICKERRSILNYATDKNCFITGVKSIYIYAIKPDKTIQRKKLEFGCKCPKKFTI